MSLPVNPDLDQLYNNRAAVPDHSQIFARWRMQSQATRASLLCELNLHYDRDEKQTLDLFPAKENRGLAIFIHGGYWRSLDKDDFSFMAAPFVAAGVSMALVNYRLCPVVSISEIIDDCSSAITWLAKNVAKYGVTFDRNIIIGHSAGAHLVAMMFAADWSQSDFPGTCHGGIAISGLYDLAPLLETSINADTKLDTATAHQLSPIHRKPRLTAALDVLVGGDETSEFIRQSELLVQHWPSNSGSMTTVAGYNHFTIVDHFASPQSVALQQALRFFD